MADTNIYRDIANRTGGDIYIGIVGPVRTGKSTFIKRFMDLLVLPKMTDSSNRERTRDELPQSASGKMIMTTEPKFIPKEAANIRLDDTTQVSVRLIDCVGYMVDGAAGYEEDGNERMVKTPWFDYEIPFSKAADIGTKKVISDHSTIGFVVTTDGSFGEIPRANYIEAENKTIHELKSLGKPFVIILNSSRPYSDETQKLAWELAQTHNVSVIPVNCQQLREQDIYNILESLLNEFPIYRLNFNMPDWLEMLSGGNRIMSSIIDTVSELLSNVTNIKDIMSKSLTVENPYIKNIKTENRNLSTGELDFTVDIDDKYYYSTLSDLTGENIDNEYALINLIKDLSGKKMQLKKVESAMDEVWQKGYGVVTPERNDISLEEPEIFKSGNKYGVKIRAKAPSIHFIKADINTEISPIVGNEEQAKDLIEFIKKNDSDSEEGIWNTNIFGKTIEQIVNDGINNKIANISVDTQSRMQNTLQKITNDGTRRVICIIL